MITKNRPILKLLCLIIIIVCLTRLFLIENVLKLRVFDSLETQEQCEEYCYTIDNNKSNYGVFGAQASYLQISNEEFLSHVTVPNCKAVKIWSLFRHGARWPSQTVFSRFYKMENIRDEILRQHGLYDGQSKISKSCRLCDYDLRMLKNWKLINLSSEQYDRLSPKGWEDLGHLANSFRTVFPNLFDLRYTPETYLLRHTIETRTELSYEAFVYYLFGYNAHNVINLPLPPRDDMLLMPYDHCDETYLRSVRKYNEVEQFLKTKEFTGIYKQIRKKVGETLDKNMYLIWQMCQYEQAWSKDASSPWCAMFTPNQLRTITYWVDLSLFHMKSHGYKMNIELACSTVADMMTHLQSNEKNPKVVAYFVHSTLLFLFLTSLGVFNENERISATNFYSMTDRIFKSSKMVPLAGNFAAVKYECSNDSDPIKIKFLLNQKPLHLPQCRDNQICTLSELSKIFQSHTNDNCHKVFCTNYTLKDLDTGKWNPKK